MARAVQQEGLADTSPAQARNPAPAAPPPAKVAAASAAGNPSSHQLATAATPGKPAHSAGDAPLPPAPVLARDSSLRPCTHTPYAWGLSQQSLISYLNSASRCL